MRDFLPDDTFELVPYADPEFMSRIIGQGVTPREIEIDIPPSIAQESLFPDDPPLPAFLGVAPLPSVGQTPKVDYIDNIGNATTEAAEVEDYGGILGHIHRIADSGVSEIAPRRLETDMVRGRASASELAIVPPAVTSSSELVSVEHAEWDIRGYRQPTAYDRVLDNFLPNNGNSEASDLFQAVIVGVLAVATAPVHRIDRKYPSVAPINVRQHMEPLVEYVQALLVERIPQPIRDGNIGEDLQHAILRQAHGAIEQIDARSDKRGLIKNISTFLMPNRAAYRRNLATFKAVEAAGKQTLDSIIAHSDKHPAYTALELTKLIGVRSAHYRPGDEPEDGAVIASGDELKGVIDELQKNSEGMVKIHTIKYGEEGDNMMAVIGDSQRYVYILYALFGEEHLGSKHSKIASIAAIGIEASALGLLSSKGSGNITQLNPDDMDIPDYDS